MSERDDRGLGAGADTEEEESSRNRNIALAALVAATALVVYLLFLGGDEYTVTAEFTNASQLVPGNEVTVSGTTVGSVKSIELGDNGQAVVKFTVSDEELTPLPRGTIATVRQGSLSSIAGRKVALTLPATSAAQGEIPDGGALSHQDTVSAVDLDQIFNTLDRRTVRDFKRVVQGFRDAYEGVAEQANRGFRYANPFLSSSRRVFAQLNRDQGALESLVVDTAQLSGALAERRADLSGVVGGANRALGAIGSQKAALARAIELLPPFMRQANTTFVNLRAALDDVDPLVEASGPVADRLGPFFAEFRAAAADAVPTIRDLARIVRRPGAGNDLVELTRSQVPLARVAIGSGAPQCGADPSADYERAADGDFSQGSLGESVCALRNSLPALAHLRAYTPELLGWFDGFGQSSGNKDASGDIGRIAATFNVFTIQQDLLPDLLLPLDPADVLEGTGLGSFDVNNHARCPGALERDPGDGSTPFTDGGAINCDPTQVPTGP